MKKRILISFIALIAIGTSLFAQVKEPSAADRGMAAEDFRRGVISYYRGAYGDSILQFEKALSYVPNEPRFLEWLGKAYLKFGVEASALDQWGYAIDYGYGGVLLKNKYEIIQNRRVSKEQLSKNSKYVVSTTFDGIVDKNLRFSQVYSVLPLRDGTFWATAYGSNELVHFDVNGYIIERTRGPLNGFDRPMDIIQLVSGNIAITENLGDRISVLDSNGRYLYSFGKKGFGDGELLGPQCLVQNEAGNIYVTDFGNKRVSVFTEKGDFLFSFGGRFDGPTGITINGNFVYVVDGVNGDISVYDFAGNYIKQLCRSGAFKKPEVLHSYNNSIYVADGNKVYSVDLNNSRIFECAKVGNNPARLTSAVLDINGNLIAPDFAGNEIEILSGMNELVGGLYVDIQRVDASRFPYITFDVLVQNRYGKDLIGLKESNFFITENNGTVKDLKYLGMVGYEQSSDITLVIDYDENADRYSSQIEDAVREIARNMDKNSTLTIVSAGEMPLIEYTGSPVGCHKFSVTRLNAVKKKTNSLELALRLAANNLISNSSKRSIILISDGNIEQDVFTKYPLADICSYLSNNSINFSSVLLTDRTPSYPIEYLESHTHGKNYYLYRSEGLAEVVKNLNEINAGIYRFGFTSVMNSGYGRELLPLEAEVYLHNRSGKDVSVYYAPLE